ncbi:hypothetical protein [Demequina oxidasica]|uniref:hypothetical protein n=1 Tax=Demequina oxidasica TaxID=676199 RepID=UPI000786538C|nr:hypothetical protein [Demequina oxidasica]
MKRFQQFLVLAAITFGTGAALTGCASGAASSPGEQQQVVEGVEYYPACGNETLTFDGMTWYQFDPDNTENFPTPVAFAAADLPGLGMSRSTKAVVAPGPGDDTGTLVVYDGGYAYFRSDSGDFTTWLTTDKIDYNFVC